MLCETMKATRVRTNLTLGPRVKAMAEEYCRQHEKTLSSLVNDLLHQFLEEYQRKMGKSILPEEGKKSSKK